MYTDQEIEVMKMLKEKYNIVLRDEQLKSIDKIYKESVSKTLIQLAKFRFVNVVLSVFFMLYLLCLDNQVKWWFCIVLNGLFSVVNLYYFIFNVYMSVKYKNDLKDV